MQARDLEFLASQVEISETLLAGKSTMFEPQDLPGRYGRVVRAIDRILEAIECPAVLAGGWAVWRYGYYGRMTQDLDIVLPADRIDEFLRTASVIGFDVIPAKSGRWPKAIHKATDTKVDILPENGRPGTISNPAPTTIPHPSIVGGVKARLSYATLACLIELKIAAGRGRDESDVIELIIANEDQTEALRKHLAGIHVDYAAKYDQLIERAREQEEK